MMAAFSQVTYEKKLKDLSATLQSIQGLSQWLVRHRSHAKVVVNVWFKALYKGCYNL